MTKLDDKLVDTFRPTIRYFLGHTQPSFSLIHTVRETGLPRNFASNNETHVKDPNTWVRVSVHSETRVNVIELSGDSTLTLQATAA